MFDLDMKNEERAEIVALFKRFEDKDLTATSARHFIIELDKINDSYHEQITEAIDEKIERSKLGDAIINDNGNQRRIIIELEIGKALIYVVQEFIKTKLHDFSEWEE